MLEKILNFTFFIFKSKRIGKHFFFYKPFKKTSDKTKKQLFSKYKNELIANNSTIQITDFGAGSKKMDIKARKVSAITKNAGISTKRASILINILEHYKSSNTLEIGTSVGLATCAIKLGNPDSKITTLEGCPETQSVAKTQFSKFNFNNTRFILGDFKKTLPKVLKNKLFDFIFFDGNHQKEATINYFEQCLQAKTENAIFIFDDIYWSNRMLEAWNYIKKHPEVSTSIDTYKWGILFFDPKLPKKHYTVRV